MSDLISRADAIEAVASITMSIHLSDVICDKLLALPSADADRPQVEIKPFDAKEVFDEMLERLPKDKPKEPHTQFLTLHTCNTCADKALCIMSAPDGNWKACKDYKPADAVQGEWIKRRNNSYNSHRLTCPKCKRTFIMPKAWGVWKGCPSCWAKLNPPKGGDSE